MYRSFKYHANLHWYSIQNVSIHQVLLHGCYRYLKCFLEGGNVFSDTTVVIIRKCSLAKGN